MAQQVTWYQVQNIVYASEQQRFWCCISSWKSWFMVCSTIALIWSQIYRVYTKYDAFAGKDYFIYYNILYVFISGTVSGGHKPGIRTVTICHAYRDIRLTLRYISIGYTTVSFTAIFSRFGINIHHILQCWSLLKPSFLLES